MGFQLTTVMANLRNTKVEDSDTVLHHQPTSMKKVCIKKPRVTSFQLKKITYTSKLKTLTSHIKFAR